MSKSTANIHGWLLLLPSMVLLVLFTHYPTVGTVYHSLFTEARAGQDPFFSGLENYRAAYEDPVFWTALSNNAIYALGTIPASIALALAMALWVNQRIPGRALVRMAYFTPTVLPMIAVANVWLFFFTPEYGLINQLAGALGLGDRNWLGDPDTALPSLMAVAIWKEAGFFMIFYLAALQSLSPSLAEAAELEGASRLYYLRRVVLPLLMPTTLFVLVNAIINAFRLIDHIVVMTGGGPNNASLVLLYYIYNVGFKYWDTGYASALTVVLVALLGGLAMLQFGVLGRRVHYR